MVQIGTTYGSEREMSLLDQNMHRHRESKAYPKQTVFKQTPQYQYEYNRTEYYSQQCASSFHLEGYSEATLSSFRLKHSQIIPFLGKSASSVYYSWLHKKRLTLNLTPRLSRRSHEPCTSSTEMAMCPKPLCSSSLPLL